MLDVSGVEARQMLTTNAENLTLEGKMEEKKEEEVKSKVGTAEREELDRMYGEEIASRQLEIEELAKKLKESTENQVLSTETSKGQIKVTIFLCVLMFDIWPENAKCCAYKH